MSVFFCILVYMEYKSCRRCSVDLIPWTNIPPSRYRAKGWICNPCHQQKTTDDRNAVKACRKCNTEIRYGDISTRKWNVSDYICKPCSTESIISYQLTRYRNLNPHIEKTHLNHSAGVYCWRYKGDIVYIGESMNIQARYLYHRVKNSSVSLKCESQCGVDIKTLTFDMICYVEDKHERLIKEFELIAEHKPILNHPYYKP